MADQPRQHRADYQQHHPRPMEGITDLFSSERGPSKSQVLTVVTLLPIGAVLLLLAGLTLTGTLIGLAVTTPLFVIFSPILVPAVLLIGLAVTGFLTSGAFGITALSSFSWLMNYLRDMRGFVPEHVDRAKRGMYETAGYLGQKTRDVGQTIESKAHEGGRT